MKIAKMLVGELILLFASIFIFRSVWTFLDQYFGYSYLLEFFVVGLVLTVVALVMLNHEAECEIRDMKK